MPTPPPDDGQRAYTEDVRLAVYDSFRRRGHAPTLLELPGGPERARAALRDLHASRDLVLDGQDAIVMAHPFSSVPLGFSVMGEATLWWGGCAWDSFAVPHLLAEQSAVLVATTCPGCGAALAWTVGRDAPPEGGQVAHFLTPVARIWDDVVHSCGNQRLFCDENCVRAWLAGGGHQRGYLMDLATLWRLAEGWYAGRLDRGYRRREPTQAAEYFMSVGLRGRFWGLPD
jgi:alkylmercury lyase-like protein